ncbi:MAG TPA: Hpt domain-containing protein [Oligoflexus sp.]|uniref:Hpt domain-containing protein n=1 Tax=Oligoflexus sp. TaxID=1971216 RepID=UPI002D7FE6CB|nr:Hpt domain-containing protein [Oligoflexus sp.]HET9239633.1 Hpt domain-containing protein [Oligoflexus sp.]
MSRWIRASLGLKRQNFQDDETFLQARITLSFALVYALAWLLYVPIYTLWLPNWPGVILCVLGGFCSAAYGAYVIYKRQDIGQGGVWANLGGCLTLIAIGTVTGGMYSPILGWIFFGSITTFLCHGRALGLLIVGTSWVGILSIDILDILGLLKTYSFPFDLKSREFQFFILLAHGLIIPALGFVTSLFDKVIRNAYRQSQSSRAIADANLNKLRFVFKSLSYGVLTIEKDGRIGSEYSKALEDILEKSQLGGAQAIPLVFQSARLPPDSYQMLLSAVEASLGEPELAFEMNEDCFPRELEYEFGARHKRVELDWKPMAGPDGTIDKILLSLKDVTEQREIAAKATKMSHDYQLLATLVQIPKEHFLATYKSARRMLVESQQILTGAFDLDKTAVKVLLMNIHTIKGECRSLHLKDVVDKAHKLEEFCQKAKNDPTRNPSDREQLRADLDHLERLLIQYQRVAHEYLGWKETDTYLQIEKAELIEILEQTPEHILGQKDSLRLASYLKGLIFVSLENFMADLHPVAQRLARDLDKAPPIFEQRVPLVYLRESGKILLQRVFTHLLRNAMDHGIEAPAMRLAKGKPAEGCLKFTAEIVRGQLIIHFSDDGQGLGLTAIRSRGKEMGFDADAMPLESLCQLVFVDGLSTASTINDISGRGVGMSAIKLFAEESGAHLELKVLEGKRAGDDQIPFEIAISLPESHFVI